MHTHHAEYASKETRNSDSLPPRMYHYQLLGALQTKGRILPECPRPALAMRRRCFGWCCPVPRSFSAPSLFSAATLGPPIAPVPSQPKPYSGAPFRAGPFPRLAASPALPSSAGAPLLREPATPTIAVPSPVLCPLRCAPGAAHGKPSHFQRPFTMNLYIHRFQIYANIMTFAQAPTVGNLFSWP